MCSRVLVFLGLVVDWLWFEVFGEDECACGVWVGEASGADAESCCGVFSGEVVLFFDCVRSGFEDCFVSIGEVGYCAWVCWFGLFLAVVLFVGNDGVEFVVVGDVHFECEFVAVWECFNEYFCGGVVV